MTSSLMFNEPHKLGYNDNTTEGSAFSLNTVFDLLGILRLILVLWYVPGSKKGESHLIVNFAIPLYSFINLK